MTDTATTHNGFPLHIPFLEGLGVQCLKSENGQGEVVLTLQDQHMNSWQVAHGGVTMTLLDVALAMAARSADKGGRGVVTLDLKTSFFQPGQGTLRGIGRCVHQSTTLAFCEGEVVDEGGNLVAKAMATFKYMRRLPVQENGQRATLAQTRQTTQTGGGD